MLINKTYQWVLLVTISVTQSIFVSTAEANIFKCTNEKGAVYYNDKPCPVKNKQKKIKAEKDVVNGYQPKLQAEDKKPRKKKEIKSSMPNNEKATVKSLPNKYKPSSQELLRQREELRFIDAHAGQISE